MKWIEAVPNFSEGSDETIISAISDALSSQKEAWLLDKDSGESTNRTVYTIAGSPESVEKALFEGIKIATQLIDMEKHRGVHPRSGACDVCPLVPMQGATMEDAIQLSHRLGKRLWEELGIPVYYYGEAALKPEHKELLQCRKGEYEGLKEKFKDPVWAPDAGDAAFNAKSGITSIGARNFLIAFNVNINGSVLDARKIAEAIRESGGYQRDKKGSPVLDEQGNKIKTKGLLKAVQAIGWKLNFPDAVQVSTNITDISKASIFQVYSSICEEAADMRVGVTGSELVGIIPIECLVSSYQEKIGISGVLQQEIEAAVKLLGLGIMKPFDAYIKILQYNIFYRTGKK